MKPTLDQWCTATGTAIVILGILIVLRILTGAPIL